jgi:GNAT superfamily N-acetyltransferase
MIEYQILEINDANIDSLLPLNEEALADEENLVDRTIKEWKSGEHKFYKKGEKLWGMFVDDKCIALGGIDIDRYVEGNDGSVGRVRHIYVAKDYRGQGLSKVIMNLIIEHAKKYFKLLRLSTSNPVACHLYESLGFEKVEGYKVAYQMVL